MWVQFELDGGPVFVNMDQVVSIEGTSSGPEGERVAAKLHLAGGGSLELKEEYTEVLSKVQRAFHHGIRKGGPSEKSD